MAQSARADIEVNVKGLKQVQELLKSLESVSTKVNQLNKATGGAKGTSKTQDNKKLRNETQIQNVLNRSESLRSSILKLNIKDKLVTSAKLKLTKAENLAKKGSLTESKKILATAQNDLILLKRKSDAIARNIKLTKQEAAAAQKASAARGKRIGGTISSAAIGGAFPLLFGQTGAAAVGGGLGGLAGGAIGGQFGFALSIVGTALGSAIDKNEKFNDSLSRLNSGFNQSSGSSRILGKDIDNLANSLSITKDEAMQALQAFKGFGNAAEIKSLANIFGSNTALFSEVAAVKDQADITKLILDNRDKLEESDVKSLLQRSLINDASQTTLEFTEAITKQQEKQNLEAQKNIRIQDRIKSVLANTQQDLLGTGSPEVNIKGVKQIPELLKNLKSVNMLGDSPSKILPKTFADKRAKEFAKQQKLDGVEDRKNSAKKLKTEESFLDIVEKTLKAKQATKNIEKLKEQISLNNQIKNLGLEEATILRDVKILEESMTDLQIKQLEAKGLTVNELVRENVETKKLADNATKVKQAFDQLSITIGNDIKNGIAGLIKGTSTLGDLLNNVADKFLDVALNQALFGSILGSSGTPGGGLLGAIGLFANGGRPPVGKPSIVGERGPELFVPRSSGTIVPNNKLGGGGSTSVVVNVDASGSDVQGDDAGAKELGTLISVAVQGELIKQQRPGGLLASVR